MKRPYIFRYLSYREYLKDMLDWRKNTTETFTYKQFCSKANLKSISTLTTAIDGTRNLTPKGSIKLAKGFDLSTTEGNFLLLLINIDQATSAEEKSHYFKQIFKSQNFKRVNKSLVDSFNLYSEWYYPVIRQMVILGDRKWTAERISDYLVPRVDKAKTRIALEALQRLKIIWKNEDGLWETINNKIKQDEAVFSTTYYNFFKQLLTLSVQSMDCFTNDQRYNSGVILNVDQEKMKKIKEIITECREKISDLESNKDNKTVMMFNINLFPLTEEIKND